MQDYHDFLAEVLIDENTLQNRIKELAAEINHDYKGKDLLLICILRGGIVFLVDLMRHITVPLQLDFMAVTSYGAGVRQSGGSVRLSLDLKTDIRRKDVLLVEDIVDSGNTIGYVLEFLKRGSLAASRFAHCWIRKNAARLPFQSTTEALASPTSLSLATVSTLMNIIEIYHSSPSST